MTTFLVTFCCATLLALLLTPFVRSLASRVGLVDSPDNHRKMHGKSTPLGGGIVVFCSFLITLGVLLFVPHPFSRQVWDQSQAILGLVLGSAALCLVGLADDFWRLRGRQKLLGQMVAVSIPISFGLIVSEFEVFGLRVELGVLAIPFTMFWLLGAINALNLLDGIDGLASSLGIILSLTIAALAVVTGHFSEALIAAAFAGGLLGFLRYNFPPATIFLGDTGSMLIGLVVGVLAITSSLKGPATVALSAPLAIWAIPILDSTAAILRRKLTGRSIYTTDRGHLHHSLLTKGFSGRETLGWISLFAACTAGGAFASVYLRNEAFAVLSVVAVVSILVVSQIFGHVELRLLNHRLMSLGRSLLSKGGEDSFQQATIRLQGTREWKQLWEAYTEAAERLGLATLDLHLNSPAQHEGYYASWKRMRSFGVDEVWRSEVPLVRDGRCVGRLEISAPLDCRSVCERIAEVMDVLEPLEQQTLELLCPAPKVMPESPASEGSPAPVVISANTLPINESIAAAG